MAMILNTTGVEKIRFSAMQTLACRGETVVTQSFDTVDDFFAFYDAHHNNVSFVIVDDKRLEFANDVCNGVYCPVVTLDIACDWNGVPTFREYNEE